MLDNPIIDIALGLMLFYMVLSLVASAVQEWIASLLGLRSKTLREGVQNLIGTEYAQRVYEHPLIKNLARKNKLPSYIAPETLSAVLLEVLARDAGSKSYVACTADEVRGIVAGMDRSNRLRGLLEALVDSGENASAALKNRLSEWFDEGMNRVSGWYKRQVKLIIFGIAGVVTVATNADSIRIAEELWRNDALRASVAAQAQAAAANEDIGTSTETSLDLLQSFPIGWEVSPAGLLGWLESILGWLITIAAVSLGAPFWFDLLGKVADLRGSGGSSRPAKAA